MPHVLVEQSFDSPLSDDDNVTRNARADPCLSEHGATWIHSYLALDRRRKVCVFEARDAEAVRAAFRSAGVSFDRIWTADFVTPAAVAR